MRPVNNMDNLGLTATWRVQGVSQEAPTVAREALVHFAKHAFLSWIGVGGEPRST